MKRPPGRVCYDCAKPGHEAKECPEPTKLMKHRGMPKKRNKRSGKLGVKDVDARGGAGHVTPVRAETQISGGARPNVSTGCPGDPQGDRGRGGVQE